jgi:uncharacterized protein
MKRLGFPNISLIPARFKKGCFAMGPESEVVDAFGNLFKCGDIIFVPLYEKAGNIFSIGSLSGRKTPRNRELLNVFNDRIEHGKVPCGDCRVLPLCGGACLRRWLESDPPCPTFKYNIEDRLKLAYNN